MKMEDLAQLESALNYHFSNPELLRQALTHSSLAHEMESKAAVEGAERSENGRPTSADNEQFEFLGDAVLGLVTSELLFQRFPQFREGELSKLRAHLVSERHLIQVAQQLELGHYLRLGRGEEKSGGRGKTARRLVSLPLADRPTGHREREDRRKGHRDQHSAAGE